MTPLLDLTRAWRAVLRSSRPVSPSVPRAVVADLYLGEDDGRVLRVAVLDGRLVLAPGTGVGPDWQPDAAEGLVLPSSCGGRLVVVLLDVLDAEDDAGGLLRPH